MRQFQGLSCQHISVKGRIHVAYHIAASAAP